MLRLKHKYVITSFLCWSRLQATHIVHSQKATWLLWSKASSVVQQFPWQDLQKTRIQPEESSGWCFQSWHNKRADVDLARPSAFLCLYTLLQQQDCHQHITAVYPPHYRLTGTAKRSSHRWPICDSTSNKASSGAASQNYQVKAVRDPLIIKLKASIGCFK